MDGEMRPEDHIDAGHGEILMIGGDTLLRPGNVLWFRPEPIDHGFLFWFACKGCGQQWAAAIDFDEMEVSDVP